MRLREKEKSPHALAETAQCGKDRSADLSIYREGATQKVTPKPLPPTPVVCNAQKIYGGHQEKWNSNIVEKDPETLMKERIQYKPFST